MSNWITSKLASLNYEHYQVSPDHLNGIMMTPAAISQDELLKRRNERIFTDMKPLVMTAYSMKSDLYASAAGPGISAVSEGAQLIVPGLDDAAGDEMTDSQFIENFIYKAGFYEDQIKSTYTGDELNAKLEEFRAISDGVIDDLAGRFAAGIGAYFNGAQSWLTDGRPVVNAEEPDFDVSAFKTHVLELVKQGRSALASLKRDYPGQWADTLSTGGANNAFFIRALEAVELGTDGGTAGSVEAMGYNDIRAVSKADGAMGKGIYTNSSDILAAYLGQEKLKFETLVNQMPMSDTVRQAFVEATDRNIAIKTASFRETWKAEAAKLGNASRFDAIYNAFACLSQADADDFRAGYTKGLKKLYDALTDQPGSDKATENSQASTAKISLASLTDGWNSFLVSIGEQDGRYFVSGLLGNTLDMSL